MKRTLVAIGLLLVLAFAGMLAFRGAPSPVRGARAPADSFGSGSPAAPPFGAEPAHRGAVKASAAESIERKGGRAPLRFPVAPGSKAWRFEKPAIGTETAGALYARLAHRELDETTAAEAARFSEVMRRCRDRVKQQKMLRAEPNEPKAATEFDRRAAELLEQSVRDADTLCADAPADAVARSDEWLARAAELGDPMARYYYGSGWHLAWVGDPVSVYATPERLVEYKPKLLEYLGALAAEGHYDSLVRLSALYMSPIYGNDPALSWAYLYAAARAQGDTDVQTRVLKQLDNLPAQERSRAQREGQRIYLQCCS